MAILKVAIAGAAAVVGSSIAWTVWSTLDANATLSKWREAETNPGMISMRPGEKKRFQVTANYVTLAFDSVGTRYITIEELD